ncbi:MAG TPA: SRPBCC family protein [Solirubrobacteraceae bacterium]
MKVSHTLTVRAPVERAFAVFTEGFGSWWPATHHLGDAELAEAIIEPRAGGRWYERNADGSECDWGHVIAWEPPHRLLLAWQLDADWRYDADLVTEVDVRFEADGDGTRVTFEHRHLERMGDRSEEVRRAIDSPEGWPGILAQYREAAAAA